MAFEYLYDAAHAWTFLNDGGIGQIRRKIKAVDAAVLQTRMDLRRAERFVLDDDFVRLAVVASFQLEKLPAWSTLARLPFPAMWIEWDQKVRRQATVDLGVGQYPVVPPDEGVHRVGGLLCQRYDDDAMWRYHEFVLEQDQGCPATVNYVFTPEGSLTLPDVLPTATHEVPLLNDGGTLMWPTHTLGFSPGRAVGEEEGKKYLDAFRERTYVSMAPFYAPVAQAAMRQKDELMKRAGDRMTHDLRQTNGVMRFLVTVLAMLNDVPKSVATVAPRTGSYKARFRDLAYMGHSLVTLKVPKRSPSRFVMAKLDKSARELAQSRRAHTVRGHYRRTNYSARGTRTSFRCDHEPMRVQGGVGQCNKCGHEVRWIPNFVRGDASLGWVEHDYLVKAS